MKTKTTYESILNFRVQAAQWLEMHEETKQPKTKFGYALHKLESQATKLWQRYQGQAEDLRIDHCMTGEAGVILKDGKGGYEFTKEGMKAFKKANDALFQSTEVEFEPYFATVIPDGLTPAQQEAFVGFALKEAANGEFEEKEKAEIATA